METNFYLLFGVFFCNSNIEKPSNLEQIINITFSGILIENGTSFTGTFRDVYGQSYIKITTFTESTLKFIKIYKGRNDEIVYNFRKKNFNNWVGHFNGTKVGHGFTRCSLYPLEKNYFSHREIIESLIN